MGRNTTDPDARHFDGVAAECPDCGRVYDLQIHGRNCPGCENHTQATLGDSATTRPDREPRTEHPHDDEFADGREGTPDAGDQAQLVADTADDQVTLDGTAADARTLWGEE